jgi:hypothetical protein
VILTSDSAALISISVAVPTSRQSTFPESITSGTTLAIIKVAMKRLAIGSNPVHPVSRMRMVEMITPTLPSVSYLSLVGCYIELEMTYRENM